MRALLWKDYRVNRIVLVFTVAVLLCPYAAGGFITYIVERYYGGQIYWGDTWTNLALYSLMLLVLPICMLGGNPVAGERADRSAEFFAYLPPSAGQRLLSKALVSITAVLGVWAFNLVVLYWLTPGMETAPEAYGGDSRESVLEIIPLLACISVAAFGGAWLGTTLLSSHVLATGGGAIAPILIAAGLQLYKLIADRPDFAFSWWFKTLCVAAGVVCFLAGTLYYLRRVEP